MKVLISIAGAVAIGAGAFYTFETLSKPEPYPAPETVEIPPGSQDYRLPGQYAIGTRDVDAPLLSYQHEHALIVMKYQVTQDDYASCVADKICTGTVRKQGEDLPQTFISFNDAQHYGEWLSERTDMHWRLPSDAEWARAAGSKFYDDALGIGAETGDPSDRWIAAYQANIEQRSAADPVVQPKGKFGENEYGVADLSGNVWEWTTSCFENSSLAQDGQTVTASSENCGVRVAEGQHRAYVVDFVRDARSGGCGVGIPPDFLGFRLVRDG